MCEGIELITSAAVQLASPTVLGKEERERAGGELSAATITRTALTGS